MALAKSFTDLRVWQESHKLTLAVYAASEAFPRSEQQCLTKQLRRSVSSIPANIAEGFERGAKKELHQFLIIARGSLGETQYHLQLAKDLGYLPEADFQKLASDSVATHRQLNALIRSVKPANKRTSALANHA